MTENQEGLDEDGPAAPPRANGELVFSAPWQSRLFGATMQLRERGHIDWPSFRHRLISEIATEEQQRQPDQGEQPEEFDYWGCWQRALETTLADVGLVSATELETTAAAIAARPPDH